MFTKLFSSPQSLPASMLCRIITRSGSPPSTTVSLHSRSGCLNTTAKTFVWRAPASIGSPSGMSLKIPAMSLSRTQRGGSAVKGNKDDKKDSKWIGDLFRMDLVPSSYIPSKDIRILREFTRYRSKLVSMRSSEKNRFQNAFTVCNLTLDAVVSDMFGKSATDIENYLLDTDTVDPEHCVSLLHRSLKKKASDVVEAVSGFNMTPEQKERVWIVQGHFADIDHRIAQLDEIISNLVAEYEGQISLLPVTNPPGKRNPSEYPEPAFT